MQSGEAQRHRWGLILAGGEGTRLRSLTRHVAGDDRPKQFCRLLGNRSLLSHTRRRIAQRISEQRTFYALVSSHRRYYSEELRGVPLTQLVVQPSNRGTLAAILSSLIEMVRLDSEAVVAIFPSDHHYSDEARLMAGVEIAFRVAESNSESVVLVGAQARQPETDYGWIEAEAHLSPGFHSGLLRVEGFWEKRPCVVGTQLLDRGLLWNAFALIGRAQAFLGMIQCAAPGLYGAFAPLLAWHAPGMRSGALEHIYKDLQGRHVSGLVFSATTPIRLGLLCVGEVGWSDLGDPQQLLAAAFGSEEKRLTRMRRAAAS